MSRGQAGNCSAHGGYSRKMGKGKGKAVPLQARRGPGGSRELRFQDFVTTAQDGGTRKMGRQQNC